MTFTVTPPTRPAVRELTSSAAAALHIAGNTLADGPLGQVGLELEAHCFELTDVRRRPGWERIRDVIAELPALPGGSVVTVEPGGAVELSGPPMAGAVDAITALAADRAVLDAEFARAGLGLVLLGADPLRPQKRVNPGARYRAMEAFFEASDTGAAGAAMMTSTASIQVNLDAGPRDGWAQRVRLAHALGPTMIALSANSPLLAGQFTGWQSSRQQVWSRLDSARCGPILGASGDDPTTDWARYALKAPVMLVHNPEPEPVLDWVPFMDWADGLVMLGGRRPTTEDLDYHLTTLFPPVRPRRWLEIRYLDSVPDALWPAVVFTLVALLDDAKAADAAAEAVEPVATAWDSAARVGLADRRLYESANTCVALAQALAPAELTASMDELARLVERGRSPGDEFSDRVVRDGIVPALTDLAGGDR
ncbi:MAG: ergothioneine biosynthesis glutamate--cysteine ligase EgtA [Mycobacterium sp.]|nr:ergothioneine biosynthesis glutamate--cysteine ligase EgtA [Mycobacterium sp.]